MMSPLFSRPVSMTRRVSFSSGHRYWLDGLSEEENRSLFGNWASRFNHGHNYVLDVTVEGHMDSTTCMILNIKRIDDLLKERVVSKFDGKSVNDEVPGFQNTVPTTENMLLHIYDLLTAGSPLPEVVRLTHIKLAETPDLAVELIHLENQMQLTLTRSYEFAASHRLHVPSLSQEENREMFGKCNNPAGHGHNYILEVTVAGEPSPRTGMIADLEALDAKVNELVVDRYDHKHLNHDVPELQGLVPTSEIVAAKIFETLDGKLPAKLQKVRLQETARNAFEVSAP
ncbi:MAG TPA: 6-carboxytetrahydropterin synthase [Fimbriimonas sp.]|nr:6-carboxytetrahydropterin synthase [Fimbriimonas sp.]